MEPIPVPAPPKSAFNKNRGLSDLLVGQLRHFQHVEHKHGIEINPVVAKDIHTEAGAARYITQMTRAIRNQAALKPSGVAVAAPVSRVAKPASKTPRDRDGIGGLSLAAAGGPSLVPRKASASKTSKKSGKKSSKKEKS